MSGTPAPPVPESVDTVRGIDCSVCGYDLTGLPESGECPECGSSIATSVVRPSLLLAAPDLIRRVRTGLRLYFGVLLLSLVNWILTWIVGVVLSFAGVMAATSAGISLLFGALNLYAWYLITTPIPRMPDPNRLRALRKWILALLWITLVVSVLTAAVSPYGSPATPAIRNPMLSVTASMLGVLTGFAGVILFFLVLAYLRRMSAFVPDAGLARRFRVLFRILLYTLVVGLAIGLAVWIALLLQGGFGVLSLVSRLLIATILVLAVGAFAYWIIFLESVYQLGSRAQSALDRAERHRRSNEYHQV